MLNLRDVRQRLEQDLQEQIARAEQLENRLRQPGDEDWEEQATQRENDEVIESLAGQAVRQIEQIKQALHRLDAGSYGTCVRCGNKIAPQRLELLPYSVTCTGCA